MAVLYQKKEKVAYITLNRPEALNALNPETLGELHDIFIDFRKDDNLWVAILTGSGEKAFCAGADIKTAIPFLKDSRGKGWRQPITPLRGLEVWKPMIAAVNGFALGGGLELVLACDIRIASENARFGVPEVTLGLIPGWGGTQRLPRAIPLAKAAEMLMTGKAIDAQEAYRIGLVNKVVSPSELMSAAEEMAKRLCRPGPLAVRAAKEAMTKGMDMTLEEGLLLEQKLEDFVLGTEDLEEGTRAFVEKRKPTFKGK
jgi:enoyl-CoA hydratase/carnithine racemase